jgi:hypothetical protein
MAGKEGLATGAYEVVYTNEHIKLYEGKYWLPIELGRQRFALPFVNVNPDNDLSMAIAWFDPSPVTNPELCSASAQSMANLLAKEKADVVVMPASSKSEGFITLASQSIDGAVLVTLPSSRNKEEVEKLSDLASVIEYKAVTGTKFMGLPRAARGILKEAHEMKRKVVLADDILSTGGTSRAMKKTLSPIFGSDFDPPILVIGQEALFTPSYPPPIENGVRVIMAIPEISGLEKLRLYSITNREEIPQAILVVPGGKFEYLSAHV